jgi:hypothetical protein
MPQKIFLFCDPAPNWGPTEVHAQALAEDGTGLGGHISSNEFFARHDIGLTSDWHHDAYREHYPDGYEVEWIEYKDLDSHEGFQKALKLNQERAARTATGVQ